MFSILLIVVVVVAGLGHTITELGPKWLDYRLKLKKPLLEIKKLEAEAIVLRLKADPKFEEREEFVRHAIKAHEDLS